MPDADAPRALGGGAAVVVTGGEGFLGAPLIRRLVELGCSVTSVDTLVNARTPDARAALGSNHQVVTVDVRDRDGLRRTIAETAPGFVFHLAALHFIPACVADPVSTLEINAVGTEHLLDACAELASPPVFVFASTADVYEPSTDPLAEDAAIGPNNVYGLSKLTGEGLVRIAGAQGHCVPVTCRLFNLFGAHETNPHVIPEIVAQLRVGDTLRLGNTTPKRDFVYVDDVADALVALGVGAPAGTVVNVGTGRSYAVDDVLSAISQLTGRTIHADVDPARWRPSDRGNLQCDNTLLRSMVPAALPTTLVDGLRRLLVDEGLLA